MSDALAFTTATRRKEPITFTLDGKMYTFNPKKRAGLVLSALDGGEEAIAAMFEWFEDGLSPEDAEEIEARLRDEDDDFDIDNLTDIIKALLAKAGGRPLDGSGGFRRQRRPTGRPSTESQPTQDSIPSISPSIAT